MTEGKKKRPGIVTVIGIIVIIFCSIGLVFSLVDVILRLTGGNEYMLAGYKSLQTPGSADLFSVMITVAEKYGRVMLLSGIALLLIRGAGLAGGILLLSGKFIGRKLLIIYSLCCILHMVFSTIWGFMYLNEMMVSFNSMIPSTGSLAAQQIIISAMKISMYAGMGFGVLLGAAWPVLVLIIMNKKSVKEYVS